MMIKICVILAIAHGCLTAVVSGATCDPPIFGCADCDASGTQCIAYCPTGCELCDSATSCTNCQLGYMLDVSGQCLACPAFCLRCSDTSSCFQCQVGYGVVDGQCQACPTYCLACIDSSDGTSCTSCQAAYYLNVNGGCSVCQQNCVICIDDTNCIKCRTGYFKESGGQCTACSPHCDVCSSSSSCSACQTGYDVEDGACTECVVTPRPIRNYPDLYRGSVIFVDFPFQCSGTVTAVEFHASRAGTFYLSAWRPSASGTSWTLLGTYTITSAHSGAQTFTTLVGERFDVQGTDVFGIAYPRGVSGIIPSKRIPKRNRDDTRSRFVRKADTIEDLTVGITRTGLAGNGDTQRIVPVNPIIG